MKLIDFCKVSDFNSLYLHNWIRHDDESEINYILSNETSEIYIHVLLNLRYTSNSKSEDDIVQLLDDEWGKLFLDGCLNYRLYKQVKGRGWY